MYWMLCTNSKRLTNQITIPYSLDKQLCHLHGVHIVALTIYTLTQSKDCMSSEFVVSDSMLEGVTLYDTCLIVNA